MAERLAGRVVVVSPHLDDAVLSLGAAIARGARCGARIEVLTVFAGDPRSNTPAAHWDAACGFRSEGEAARARREEDRRACARLGAEPFWLELADGQYEPARDEREVEAAVSPLVAGADAVLLPGFPLRTGDHAWLSEALLRRGLPCGRIALYAEQPYRYRAREAQPRPVVPPQLRPLAGEVRFARLGAGLAERRAKLEAVRAYGSQLPLLGLAQRGGRPLRAMLLHEALHGGERIAWLPGTAAARRGAEGSD